MKTEREQFLEAIENEIKDKGLNISSKDFSRPWGGFFVIDETQAQHFSNLYFDALDVAGLKISGKLSPKILVVAPHQRLSWQYHHRRAEIWQVVNGTVGIVRSNDNDQGELLRFGNGEQVLLQQGERHRLVGLENWGVVAEIWQHTDPENPSDENDILRVQDDYSRQ